MRLLLTIYLEYWIKNNLLETSYDVVKLIRVLHSEQEKKHNDLSLPSSMLDM